MGVDPAAGAGEVASAREGQGEYARAGVEVENPVEVGPTTSASCLCCGIER